LSRRDTCNRRDLVGEDCTYPDCGCDRVAALRLADPDAAMMSWLTFMPSGLRINTATGEVVIPDGLSLDDASRTFWLNLGRFHPLHPSRFG
jgi:hypothetical protein